MCCQETTWIQTFIQNVVAPLIVASVAYYLFGLRDELKKRKNYSRLGAAIIQSLIEEVRTGANSIDAILNNKEGNKPILLPRKSWNGINTIPDDVLLRILAFDNQNGDGFKINEVRIHLKNYFDHMVPNWDYVVEFSKKDIPFRPDINYIIYAKKTFPDYDKAALGVLKMLENIEDLLLKNTKKTFPK
jgi:hypothetical protein